MKWVLLFEKFQDRIRNVDNALKMLKEEGRNPLKAYELILYIIDNAPYDEGGINKPEIRQELSKYKDLLLVVKSRLTIRRRKRRRNRDHNININIDLDNPKEVKEFLKNPDNLQFAKELNYLIYGVMYNDKGESIMKSLNESAERILKRWTSN